MSAKAWRNRRRRARRLARWRELEIAGGAGRSSWSPRDEYVTPYDLSPDCGLLRYL